MSSKSHNPERSRQQRELLIERESLRFADLSKEQLLRRLSTLSIYSRENYRKVHQLRKQLSELLPAKQTKESTPKRAKK